MCERSKRELTSDFTGVLVEFANEIATAGVEGAVTRLQGDIEVHDLEIGHLDVGRVPSTGTDTAGQPLDIAVRATVVADVVCISFSYIFSSQVREDDTHDRHWRYHTGQKLR